MQTSVHRTQSRVDAVQRDFMTLKQLVVKTRPGISRLHVDVQQLENNIELITARWENLVIQVSDRYGCWPDGLELIPGFYLRFNEQHRLF